MLVRNYLSAKLEDAPNMHDGKGVCKHVSLFGKNDFNSKIGYFNYTILPPGTVIGQHKHGDDEELYIVLEGEGVMTVDGATRQVVSGDVIVNKSFGTHGIENNGGKDLKLIVFEVKK